MNQLHDLPHLFQFMRYYHPSEINYQFEATS